MSKPQRSQSEISSLIEATYRGNVHEVRKRLAAGADVNWQSDDGCPLLHYAVMGGDAEMVTVLLEAGADVNARTLDKVTPLINGIEWGYLEVAKVLLAHGADLRAQDEYGRTAMKIASDHGQTRMVALLQQAVAMK
jgi:ankyrin repeat protein